MCIRDRSITAKFGGADALAAALEADQYAGYLVVETHVKKRPPGLQMRDGLDGLESNSLDNLDCLRTHLQRLAD